MKLLSRLLPVAAAAIAVTLPAQAAETTRVIVASNPAPGARRTPRWPPRLAASNTKSAVPTRLRSNCRRKPRRRWSQPERQYVEEDVKRYMSDATTPSTGMPYAMGQLVPWGIKAVQADQVADTNASTRMVRIIDSGYPRGETAGASAP